jgi:hypothetical protein
MVYTLCNEAFQKISTRPKGRGRVGGVRYSTLAKYFELVYKLTITILQYYYDRSSSEGKKKWIAFGESGFMIQDSQLVTWVLNPFFLNKKTLGWATTSLPFL